MDMYSKMDGSTPVSPALGGVWSIQKKSATDDRHNNNSKKTGKYKEKEKDFEDGWVPDDQEMTTDAETKPDDQNDEGDTKDDNPSSTRKIDILI